MDHVKKMCLLKLDDQELKIFQRKDMFCILLDTLLIVNFINIKNQTKSIIDFGTNNGVIAILLAAKFPVKVIGIEIQKEAIALANENVKINNLTNRVTIIHEDIKIYAQKTQIKVDLIICNPPFFPLFNKSKVKLSQPLKIPARHEIYINLEEIICSAAKLLKNKGRLVMIHSIERMNELLFLLKKYQLTPKKLQIVYPKINKPANVFLIEAVFLAKTGMVVLPPLICHNLDNTYTNEIAKWYNFNEKSDNLKEK